MHTRYLLALSLALGAAASRAFAQSATGELRPGVGVRVRVESSSLGRVKGTLLSATRDSLVLTSNDYEIAFDRKDVAVLEVKRRRARSTGALRLATWVGAISGALLAPVSLGDEDYTCGSGVCRNEGGDFAQITAIGFLASLYGQVIGAIWPGKEWLRVSPAASTPGNVRPPTRGTRVRITASGYTAPKLEGAVATATSDSLVLLVRSAAISVPMTSVTHLEYANGSAAGRGALRGLMQSVPMVGFYLTLALQEQTTTTYRDGVQEAVDQEYINGTLTTAALAAAIGAGLGAIIAPREWTESRVSTSLLVVPDPQHKAMRVGVSVNF